MTGLPDNAIAPLVGSNGMLSSFEIFPENHLRQALAQMIDGLERLDELASNIQFLAEDWRQPNREADKQWESLEDESFHRTPVVMPTDPEEHWGWFTWADHKGTRNLKDMNRPELETAIRDLWPYYARFARLGSVLARDAHDLTRGEYLQREDDKKPEVEPSRSPRP